MAEENTARKKAAVVEEDNGAMWKVVTVRIVVNGLKLIAAGVVSGFGMSLGQDIHRKMLLAGKQPADVVPLRKTV